MNHEITSLFIYPKYQQIQVQIFCQIHIRTNYVTQQDTKPKRSI